MLTARARSKLNRLITSFGVIFYLSQPLDAQPTSQAAQPNSGWGATIFGKAESASKPKKVPLANESEVAKTTPPPLAVPAPLAIPSSSTPVVSRAGLTGDAKRTRLTLDISTGATFTVFRMTSPFRVVVDLADVAFRLPPGTGKQGRGLVSAYRYGLFAPGKARVVIDTAGPARVENAGIAPTSDRQSMQLVIDLVPTTASEIAAAELAAAAQTIDVKPDMPQPTPSSAAPKSERAKPVIVIDPGHGGIDPGAQGAHGVEKDVVLAVAREVRRSLLAQRGYEVIMTRSNDVFVSLDQRVRLTQRHRADLFVSIHADSLAQKELAQNIRGATIYTLAEKASDERSRALAEKENAVDLLAGINVNAAANDGQVRDILVDLMRRESHNFSSDFRGLLVSQLRPKLRLAKDPTRSAPFKVLRQPGSPAVLIELGYMSNAEDERQMASLEWQRGVADAVAKAIADYFQKHPTKSEP